MYTILDNDGFVKYAQEQKPTTGRFTELVVLEKFIKAKINDDETAIIEGATPEEIAEANKIPVPEIISRMGLKIMLKLKGIEIQEIVDTINDIPDSMFSAIAKEIAIIKFQEAAYFDRYNADLQLVATLMGLSQDDLDEIFINGKKY